MMIILQGIIYIAKKLNRNCIVIEIKPEYVQVAKNRLREEIPLFA